MNGHKIEIRLGQKVRDTPGIKSTYGTEIHVDGKKLEFVKNATLHMNAADAIRLEVELYPSEILVTGNGDVEFHYVQPKPPKEPQRKTINPWNDEGWKEAAVPVDSPCCHATIFASSADGIMVGACSSCGAWCTRFNPSTGKHEMPEQYT